MKQAAQRKAYIAAAYEDLAAVTLEESIKTQKSSLK